MAVESGRKQKLKRISDPSNSANYVDIPVIVEIDFIDQKANAQDYKWSIDNSGDADRETHIVNIPDDNADTSDPEAPDSSVDVERIDKFKIFDAKSDGQRYVYIVNNNADPPEHRETHEVTYYQDNDESKENSVTVQYIDKLGNLDQKSNSQESYFVLTNNAQDGDDVDLSLPDF